MNEVTATYRVQVHTVGGLDGLRDLLPYFRDLGVSTLYVPPVFRARSGSDHGYDVVDPGRVDPALGGAAALDRLGSACREAGLSLLLDIVPNHMAANHENPWWWSLLEEGPDADTGEFFDVDWDQPPGPVRGKVVLPILGRRYHQVVASGDLHVVRGRDGLLLRYGDRVLPLKVDGDPDEETVERLNRAGSDPEARGELDALLTRQSYWLVHWRTVPEELNYRRFFNITHLAALRMEREDVFREWHRLLGKLLAELPVSGIRVDHVDGLLDPATYLSRLQSLVRDAGRDPEEMAVLVEKVLGPAEDLPEAWRADGTTGYDFMAVTDGVLVNPEGLGALRDCYRSFTSAARSFREEARRAKRAVARDHFRRELDRLVEDALPRVRRHPLGRDLTPSELEAALLEITAQLRVYRTYLDGPTGARAEPEGRERDRSEVRHAPDEPEQEVRSRLDAAAERGRRRRHDLPAAAFSVLRSLLSPDRDDPDLGLIGRWQQLTGAVMAKGVEDTAFYTHVPLVSLNEVGAHPDASPVAVSELHEALGRRASRVPRTLNATSTHDTKRSEDVRARIHVLSELARQWGRKVESWHRWNRDCRERAGGRSVPTPNEEWLLYQTLVGTWPLEGGPSPELVERLEGFALKAAREAKIHTSWRRPNRDHEEALLAFVRGILDPGRDAPFLDDFLAFQREVAFYGAVNSLSRLTTKLAAPGTPDFYQGNELWRFSLVDPDNRRPVDWERRRALLAELRRTTREEGKVPGRVPHEVTEELLAGWRDGRIKLLVTWRGLALRRRRSELFRNGAYLRLEATGARSRHVVAFARRLEDEWVAAVAPRLPVGLAPAGSFPVGESAWKDTALSLPDGDGPERWRDVLTGREFETGGSAARLDLAGVLARLPVALLHGFR